MKNMRLSVRLIGSFVLVALIALAVGAVGWYGATVLGRDLTNLSTVYVPAMQSLYELTDASQRIVRIERTLLSSVLDAEARGRQYENLARIRADYKKHWDLYDSVPKSAEEAETWRQLGLVWQSYKNENDEFFRLAEDMAKSGILNPLGLMKDIEHFRGDHYKLLSDTANMLHTGKILEGGEDPGQCGFGKWLAAYKTDNAQLTRTLETYAPVHARFHQEVKKIKDVVKSGDPSGAMLLYEKEMIPLAQETLNHFGDLIKQAAEVEELYYKMNRHAMTNVREKEKEAMGLLDKLVKLTAENVGEADRSAIAHATMTKTFVTTGTIAGFILALALGVFSSLKITRPLYRVIHGLAEGSEHVVSASCQVTAASQKLADGASEQASAIEETSSALEEISSMTRRNADNAGRADTFMAETGRVLDEAKSSMEDLSSAMDEISKAGEETQKIIKTIDEIAFQTNLLALNAAVEAARAGEAGAGFAVVADEVRNLAMRAAEAARHTAGLIEGTVQKVGIGVEIVTRAAGAFDKVAGGARKAGDLVGEITAASKEQSQGIEQINQAVADMDKVTQQNAATAEESASAAEEMNSRAKDMKTYVTELSAIVGNRKDQRLKQGGKHQVSIRSVCGQPSPKGGKAPVIASGGSNGNENARTPARLGGTREIKPEEAIAFDDSDTDEFQGS